MILPVKALFPSTPFKHMHF